MQLWQHINKLLDLLRPAVLPQSRCKRQMHAQLDKAYVKAKIELPQILMPIKSG